MTTTIARDALGSLLADLPAEYVTGSVIAGYAVVAWAAGNPDGATIWGVGITVASARADAYRNLGGQEFFERWTEDEEVVPRCEHALPYGYVIMPCTEAILRHPDLHPLWEARDTGIECGSDEVGTVVDLYEEVEVG